MCAGNCNGCDGCSPVVLRGQRGFQGLPGQTPDIEIQVQGLPAGNSPTVAESGTLLNPVFTIGIPAGATGPAGNNGADGQDATNLFTNLVSFNAPGLDVTNIATVGDTSWMVVGGWVYIRGGGYFRIAAINSATEVQLANPGPNALGAGIGWPTGVPGNSISAAVASLGTPNQVIQAAVPGLPGEEGDTGPAGPSAPPNEISVVYTVPTAAPVSPEQAFVFVANAAPPTPATSFRPYTWNGSAWVAGPNIAGQGGTKTFSGSADPNVTPPSGSNINDFYWRNQGSSVVLYERTGTTTWTVRATLTLGAVTQTTNNSSPGTVALDLASFSHEVTSDKNITLNWDDTNNSEQGEWTVVLENVDGGSNIDLDFTAARWEYDPALTPLASLPISLAPGAIRVIEFKKNVRSGLYVITNYFAPSAL